jgi:hypothetical protein
MERKCANKIAVAGRVIHHGITCTITLLNVGTFGDFMRAHNPSRIRNPTIHDIHATVKSVLHCFIGHLRKMVAERGVEPRRQAL